MSDWDAAKYHRISDPQLAWGRAVAARLAPVAGERILDLGCGTGRLTEEIARTSGIHVVGLDRSGAMLREAAARRGQTPATGERGLTPGPREGGQTPGLDSCSRLAYVLADGAVLPFAEVFDAVFSTATFHWIPDHDRLFRSVYTALKSGGRVIAQCGGGGNLDRLYGRARALMRSPAYAPYFTTWSSPNHFENVADTEQRLARAGFEHIDVSLVMSPVTFDSGEGFTEFVAAVCLRHHLDRLPGENRDEFMHRITDQATADDPPLTLDYWRLNIAARKGRA
jgi:trans-aconitate 2-methyltransferase